MNGTLRGAERDVFRVAAKAGERRVFEVDARRSGSAVDPVLRILDGSGKQLARSETTRARDSMHGSSSRSRAKATTTSRSTTRGSAIRRRTTTG